MLVHGEKKKMEALQARVSKVPQPPFVSLYAFVYLPLVTLAIPLSTDSTLPVTGSLFISIIYPAAERIWHI